MNTRHLIGIDIGTSGLKCALIDEAGQLRAAAFREYTPVCHSPAGPSKTLTSG
jgi:sugar (pentulose or hexulose) kinase